MGSVRLCNLPGEFSEGDKGTKVIPGKPHRQSWGGGQLATQLDMSLRLRQAERTYKANAGQASSPTPRLLVAYYSQGQGRSQHHKQDQPWDAPGVARMAEKGRRVPGHNAARTMSPTVPSNPDRPALPETNTPMYHHMGSCFHRNLPGLWNTLCKNYSFF